MRESANRMGGKAVRAPLLLTVLLLMAFLVFPVGGEGLAGKRVDFHVRGGPAPSAAKAALLHNLVPRRYPAGSYAPGEVAVELAQPTLFNAARLMEAFSYLLQEDASEFLSRLAARPMRRVLRLRLRQGWEELEACRRLLSSPLVRNAEPNLVFRAAVTVPDDPRYSQQWNLWDTHGVNADAAWDLQRGSSSLVLAVIDTGIDFSHADLAGRILSGGYDYVNGDPDPSDDDGHGTMMAGIACAATDNLRGVAGIDWNARIMPIKALNSRGEGKLDAVVNSIYHAADRGARVINMSFTATTYSSTLQEAVEYARARGCVMAAAAGNEGTSVLNYPAGLTYVLGVGSIGRSGYRSYFSNHNPSVDLVAPGEDIWSTALGNAYTRGSGTSEATAHVSAAALLLMAEYPGSAPEEVWRRLRDGARDLGSPGYDEEYGWGALDLFNSLRVPLVSITSPTDLSYPASGKVSASASSANVGIKYLELWVDGELKETRELPTPDYSVSHTFTSWDLADMGEGAHEITVKAVDAGGTLSGEHAVTVFRNSSQPRPSTDWYLAEGCTAFGFEEYILVQNPNPVPTTAAITFMRPDGSTSTRSFPMNASSRLTVNVNALVPGSDVSAHVHADQPVVAERAMYWGGRDGGHGVLGVPAPSSSWYFAEGCTAFGFEEYLLIQNPNPDDAVVTLEFRLSNGTGVRRTVSVGPRARRTVNVADVVPGNDVSLLVRSDLPVVAERAMYWPCSSRARAGGHAGAGSLTPATTWHLAEGSTAHGFEEYVLLYNPTAELAHVLLTFMREDGSAREYRVTVPAGARYTVTANAVDPGRDASVKVASDRPLVAERAMYWWSREGGTAAAGVLQP